MSDGKVGHSSCVWSTHSQLGTCESVGQNGQSLDSFAILAFLESRPFGLIRGQFGKQKNRQPINEFIVGPAKEWKFVHQFVDEGNMFVLLQHVSHPRMEGHEKSKLLTFLAVGYDCGYAHEIEEPFTNHGRPRTFVLIKFTQKIKRASCVLDSIAGSHSLWPASKSMNRRNERITSTCQLESRRTFRVDKRIRLWMRPIEIASNVVRTCARYRLC